MKEDAEEVGEGRSDVKRVSSWASGNLAAKCSLSLSASVDMRNEAEPRRWGCACRKSQLPGHKYMYDVSLSARESLSHFVWGRNQIWPFKLQGQKGRPQSRDGSVAVANAWPATAAGLHDKLPQKS